MAGRSGGKWLGDIFNAHDHATGKVEPAKESAAWYRWVTYNKLPVDISGVEAEFKYWIVQDWKKGDIAYIVSPYFSQSVARLYEVLRPNKILLLMNEPEFIVQSMYNKGTCAN